MKYITYFIGVGVLIALAFWLMSTKSADAPEQTIEDPESTEQTEREQIWTDDELEQASNAMDAKSDLIVINDLTPGANLSLPHEVTGKARGYWFFEAVFPVKIVDEFGNSVEVVAVAGSEWMTEEFVPFTVTLQSDENLRGKGEVIFQRDNPSGLPENDDELRIPVIFE